MSASLVGDAEQREQRVDAAPRLGDAHQQHGTPCRDHDRCAQPWLTSIIGNAVVAFTLVPNLSRSLPIVSLAAALIIAFTLYLAWAKAGRTRGIHNIAVEAEAEPA
ncbi:hypothetical protein J7E80_23350 [Arthrobacter sp. ISL-28]|nr:hypothetical protein [Arthrobacter sp. ISL-28]